jgi:hypothetical protein
MLSDTVCKLARLGCSISHEVTGMVGKLAAMQQPASALRAPTAAAAAALFLLLRHMQLKLPASRESKTDSFESE